MSNVTNLGRKSVVEARMKRGVRPRGILAFARNKLRSNRPGSVSSSIIRPRKTQPNILARQHHKLTFPPARPQLRPQLQSRNASSR